MFQHKINVIFKEPPNVFGITDDILIVGYDPDGRYHDRMLRSVMQICFKETLKLTKINIISGVSAPTKADWTRNGM